MKTRKTCKKPVALEFEGRILDINYNDFISKIKQIGGKLKAPLTLYKRSTFGLCGISRGFVRVRDEGNKVMMTAKIYKDPKFPEEYELEIKDNSSTSHQDKTISRIKSQKKLTYNIFENGSAFLEALNLTKKAYHETMREKWSLFKPNGTELCEIAIDFIPGLPTYAELECKSKTDLIKTAKLFGYTLKDLSYGGYGKVFVHYYGMAENEINDLVSSLTFNNIINEIEKYIHKNEELLKTIQKQHLEIYRKLTHN